MFAVVCQKAYFTVPIVCPSNHPLMEFGFKSMKYCNVVFYISVLISAVGAIQLCKISAHVEVLIVQESFVCLIVQNE